MRERSFIRCQSFGQSAALSFSAGGPDSVHRLGERVRLISREVGGPGCRRSADTFCIYCPHQDDYAGVPDKAPEGLVGEDVSEDRARLRLGVYSQVDKSLQSERHAHPLRQKRR